MNLKEMRQRTYRMLGVTDDDRLHWEHVQMDRALNRAYREHARRTGCLEMRESIEVSDGVGHYTTSKALRRLIRVTYDDRLLSSNTFWAMDRTVPNWEDASGYVQTFVEDRRDDRVLRLYRRPTGTAGTSFDLEFGVVAWTDVETTTFAADTTNNASHTDEDLGIVVHWTLTDGTLVDIDSEFGVVISSDLGNDRLKIWGKRNPPNLVKARDIPEIPQYAHLGICFTAASRLLRQRGDGRDPKKAKAYKALGEESMEFLSGEVNRRIPERMFVLGRAPGRNGRILFNNRFLLGNAPIPSS